eukprot:g6809.t1
MGGAGVAAREAELHHQAGRRGWHAPEQEPEIEELEQDMDYAREFHSDAHTFHNRKASLMLYRNDVTLEKYQGFLLPILEDHRINLVEHLAMEERRLELGVSADEHEYCLIRGGWSVRRYLKSLDEETCQHLRDSEQLDEAGQVSSMQTWTTRFAAGKADNRIGWYQNVLKSVLVDGIIDHREKMLLRNIRLMNGISNAEHRTAMLAEGVTPEEERAMEGSSPYKSSVKLHGRVGRGRGRQFGASGVPYKVGRGRRGSSEGRAARLPDGATLAAGDGRRGLRSGEVPDSLYVLTVTFGEPDSHVLQRQAFFKGAHRAVRVALVRTPSEDAGGERDLMRNPHLIGQRRARPERSVLASFRSYKHARDTEPVTEEELDFSKTTLVFGRSETTSSNRNPDFKDFQCAYPVLRSKLAKLTLVVQLVHVHQRKKAGHITVLGQRTFSDLDKVVESPRLGVIHGEVHTGNPARLTMHHFNEGSQQLQDTVSLGIKLAPLTFNQMHHRTFHGISSEMQTQISSAYRVPGVAAKKQERVSIILREIKSYHEQLYHVVLRLLDLERFEDVGDTSQLSLARVGRSCLLRLDSTSSAGGMSAEQGLALFRKGVAAP